MNRWTLKVQDDNGRARLVVSNDHTVIGMINMPYGDYVMLTRHLTQKLLQISSESLKKTLHERFWQDAVAKFDNSPELAMTKLKEFGWNSEEWLESLALELARNLTESVADHLPEHT